MDIYFIIFGLVVFFTTFYYLDAKHGYRFIDWMNCRCSNPFIKADTSSGTVNTQSNEQGAKDMTIIELKECIVVLEKIVTEPAYELNKKLNEL